MLVMGAWVQGLSKTNNRQLIGRDGTRLVTIYILNLEMVYDVIRFCLVRSRNIMHVQELWVIYCIIYTGIKTKSLRAPQGIAFFASYLQIATLVCGDPFERRGTVCLPRFSTRDKMFSSMDDDFCFK